jgi:hypothetical protein
LPAAALRAIQIFVNIPHPVILCEAKPTPSQSESGNESEGLKRSLPCHFDQSVSGVEKSLPAGQRQGSCEECAPTYFFG